MRPLKVDLLSVTFDPETTEIRFLIVTQHSAAITLQPSKFRHLQLIFSKRQCITLRLLNAIAIPSVCNVGAPYSGS